MTSKLSLTPEKLEILLEMYRQVLETPAAIEESRKELPHLIKRMAKAKSSKLVLMRLMLNFTKDPTIPMTGQGLREKWNLKEVSKRQLDRDLTYLLESKVLTAETTGKGVWHVPRSRLGERGHPPRRYSLNPFAASDYIWSDSVDNETRRFFSFAQKFLSSAPGVMDATVRAHTAILDMTRGFPELVDAARRIPEINKMLTKEKLKDANTALARMAFVIVEETAGASILRSRIALDGEELPELEAMRLGLLLGLASSWKGWEGGDRAARASSTDSTRGI